MVAIARYLAGEARSRIDGTESVRHPRSGRRESTHDR
jgi:hypothetical protein